MGRIIVSCPYCAYQCFILTSEIVLSIVFIPYLEFSEMSHLLHQIQSTETSLDEIVLYRHVHSSISQYDRIMKPNQELRHTKLYHIALYCKLQDGVKFNKSLRCHIARIQTFTGLPNKNTTRLARRCIDQQLHGSHAIIMINSFVSPKFQARPQAQSKCAC